MRTPTARNPWLQKAFPLLGWWPRVGWRSSWADLLAGLTGAIIVLPQGVAFATIAGLPPEYGLYAAMVPAIVAALFGSSWHLISGPTTPVSIVVLASISPLAEPGSAHYIGLVLTLTFLAGLFQLAMGLARLGTLVNYISHTVITGFTAGAAVLIAASQLKNFFGIPVPRGASFSETIQQILLHAGNVNPYATAVGAAALLSGILARKFLPRGPYMIVAMVCGSAAALLFDQMFGAETTGIRTVGALPAGLPPFSRPDLSAEAIRLTAPSALAVAVLALTESVSIARAIAARSGQRIDGNQEFVGQGLSNLLGSFFSGYAACGSLNRSGVNYQAGAQTPLAAVFAAIFLAGILLLVAPLAAYLPLAAMAGILFLVAYALIDFHSIRAIVRTSRRETFILLATLFATLFAALEFAIYVGVALSLMLYLNRTSRPTVTAVMAAPEAGRDLHAMGSGLPGCPQLKIVRIDGSIFFGAVDHVQRQLHRIGDGASRHQHVLIVADGIDFIDLAGAELLAREARQRRKMSGGLYFHRMKDEVRETLARSGFLGDIGEENIFPAGSDAVGAIRRRLDPGICRACTAAAFVGCDGIPSGDTADKGVRISG